MLFDQATDTQMQAARILGAATMAALLAAPLFRRRARQAQIAIAGLYFAGVVVFIIYALI